MLRGIRGPARPPRETWDALDPDGPVARGEFPEATDEPIGDPGGERE